MANTILGLKYPSSDKIASRTSTVARAMASSLAAIVEATAEETEALSCLLDNNELRCVYCGCKDSPNNKLQLDHLYPLVDEKGPSGYYTEPRNLVPCCSACNGSKGSKQWDDYMDIKCYIEENNLNAIMNDKDTDDNVRKRIYLFKNNSQCDCDLDDVLLEQYFSYVQSKSKRNGKENTFIRLYENGSLNGKVDINGEYHAGLKDRRIKLMEYCDKHNLPYKDKKGNTSNQEEHRIFFDDEVIDWWEKLYSSIKLSLETAQIQIDAFKAGIRSALKENNNVDIETSFNLYIEELKKLNIRRSQSKRILVESGIIKEENDLDIAFDDGYANAIKKDAKEAFEKGVEYTCRNKDQKSLLKKLYS